MNSSIKVLLIDDDEEEFFLLKDHLDDLPDHRYSLSWSSSYEEGLTEILSGQHEVYLIDYRLGPESGLDLLQAVKDKALVRATIVLTGRGDKKIDIQAMEMGAFDYLVKGEFSAKDLDRAMRYAIERRKVKASLRFQAEILKNVHDAVLFITEEGKILNWNDGATRIFKVPSSEAIGASVLEICLHEGQDPLTNRIIPRVKKSGPAEEALRCRLKSGEEIMIRVKVTEMSQGETNGFVICASDITEQKKLEAEIFRVSENEQRRIGQDLHDDLCSHLAGIAMMAKVLETQFRENHEKEAALIGEISDMVADAGQKARQIAKGLVPAALETQGLPGAIHELAGQEQTLFGLPCVATVSGTDTIDTLKPGVKEQLFRIAQEATTNAMKHSDAERVQIRLTGKDGTVRLEITDDGKGIPDDLISNGMGMLTMRRRAELIDAELELHSCTKQGTTISCIVETPPYEK